MSIERKRKLEYALFYKLEYMALENIFLEPFSN